MSLTGEQFKAYVKKLRPHFQRGLLDWYRGEDLHAALDCLDAVVLHVEKVIGSTPAARLWWVARAVVQALKAEGLNHSVSLKLLLGQVDRQLRMLGKEGEAACQETPSDELLKNLLYYVAQSSCNTRRVAAVRLAFRLDELVADDQEPGLSEHPLFGPNLEAANAVSSAVKEHLDGIKDALDRFSRKEQRDVAELAPLLAMFQEVADTLGLLGLGMARRAAIEQRDILEDLIENDRAPSNEQLMDMASTLLGVDATMDSLSGQGVEPTIMNEQTMVELDPGDSHLTGNEYLQLVTSVIGEIKTDLAVVKDAIAMFLEDSNQRHRLDEVPRRVGDVIGGMRMLYLEPAAELTQQWLQFVDRVLLQPREVPEMTSLEGLAEGAEALEYYLESVASARPDAEERLSDARGRIEGLPSVPDESTGGSSFAETRVFAPELDLATMLKQMDVPASATTEDSIVDFDITTASLAPISATTIDFSVIDSDVALDADEVTMFDVSTAPSALFSDERDETMDVAGLFARISEESLDLELSAETDTRPVAESDPSDTAVAAGKVAGAPGTVNDGVEMPDAVAQSLAHAQALLQRMEQDPPDRRDEDDVPEMAPHEVSADEQALLDLAEGKPVTFELLADDESSLEDDDKHVGVATRDAADWPAYDEEEEPESRTYVPSSDLEPEILQIFLEEADEVLSDLQQAFPVWSDNPNDKEALTVVRRSYHTLKGSGRLVGAMKVGDFCWSIENMLNRVIDGVISPTPAVVGLVGEAGETLPMMLRELSSTERFNIDVNAMAARAQALAEAAARGTGNYAEVAEQSKAIAAEMTLREADEEAAEAREIEAGISRAEGDASDTAEVLEFPLSRDAPTATESTNSTVHEVFCQEAPVHLAVLQSRLGHADDVIRRDPQSYLRALHTLTGSARAAGMASMAEVCADLEAYLSTLHQMHEGISTEGLNLIADALAETRTAVDTFTTTGAAEVDRAAEFAERAQLLSDLTIAEPKLQLGDDEPEGMLSERLELRDIFLEEAGDILDVYESVIERWRAAGGSLELLGELQRGLHTLKGSARMVQATNIGDLSHSVENIVMAAADGRYPITDELLSVVEMGQERIADMLDCMVARQPLMSPADLIEQIEALLAAKPSAPADTVQALQSADASVAGRKQDTTYTTDTKESAAAPSEPETPTGDLTEDMLVPDPTLLEEIEEEPEEERALLRTDLSDDDPLLGERGGRIQVDATLLDNLVGYAGEISISQSRIELQVGAFRHNLEEMQQTVSRLREQLRQLELETESQIIYRHERENTSEGEDDFDPLELDRFTRMQELSRGLAESVGDLGNIRDMLTELTRESEGILIQQARTNTDLQHGLMQTRMLPIERLVPRFRRIVRQTARELEKQIRVEITGEDIRIDRAILNRMVGPLEHIFRNAVDHGVEAPSLRAERGKEEVALLQMDVSRDGPEVVIRIADDGNGIDLEAVRSRALQRELLQPDAQVLDDELVQIIFEPGFSTSSAVTQISGRGVGLDVVQNEVKQLGGSVHAETQPRVGATFTIRLPLTLAINQALMVGVGSEELGLPLVNIEAVLRMPAAEAEALEQEDAPFFEAGGLRYPFAYLGASLGVAEASYQQDRYPVVLVRAGDNRMAIRVDELRGRHEVVVKAVGPMLSAIPWVSGATIMGDGRVVLILDAPTLVRLASTLRNPAPVPVGESAERGRLVMVVDDSITVRKVTGRFLQRNGMEVVTAKDGREALAMLQEQLPDVILLDIEMPRMDGFELATTIRNDARMKALPIIVITSRTGQKHTERARRIGIDRYLGKPYHEGELLDNINALLTEAQRARV